MNKLKISFKKLFLLLPMLAFLFSLTSYISTTISQKTIDQSVVFQKKSNSKHSTLIISSNNDEKELIYNESELSEFEIELDFFHNYSFEDNFLDLKFKSGINSKTLNFHSSNQKLPLYDLFCKWKLHIS